MTNKAIVFIDGNNLYHNAKVMKLVPRPKTISKMVQEICKKFNCSFQKAIYYNSIPSIIDGKNIYYNHLKFLDKIRALPKFEVKTRKLQRRSNKEVLIEKKEILNNLGICNICKSLVENDCEDCIGNINKKEKGVDMLIGIDMINLSIIQNECTCCILISGDADFIPAMELIKKNGKKVLSAFLTKGYSYDIRNRYEFLIMNRKFFKNLD